MSALIDALQQTHVSRPGPRCTVGAFLERDDDIAKDLADLLTSDEMSTTISDALARLDPPVLIQHGTLQRHRRGRCTCGRTR